MNTTVATPNPFAFIVTPIEQVAAKVEAGLKYLGGVAKSAIAWVSDEAPGSGAVMAGLFQAGDTALVSLEDFAAKYGSDVINDAVAGAETFLANHVQSTGLDLTTKTVLNAGDVAALSDAAQIGQLAIQAGLAKLVAGTNSIATAATVAAKAAPPASVPLTPPLTQSR